MKITKADFDNATAQPWDDRSCLLQQPLLRRGEGPHLFPPLSTHWKDGDFARELMDLFDSSYKGSSRLLTAHEKLTGLCLLRAMLPMDV